MSNSSRQALSPAASAVHPASRTSRVQRQSGWPEAKLGARHARGCRGGFNGSTNFFGLGCSVCAMMHLRKPREAAHYLEADMGKSSSNEGGTAFATFTVVPSMCMKASRFRRHASSKLHQAAVRAADSTKFPITSSAIVEFREALQQMRRGRSARDMLDGVLSDRVLLIRWCISEAVLQKYRAFLRTAEAICLTRDCRDGRLLMRFRASRASDLQAP